MQSVLGYSGLVLLLVAIVLLIVMEVLLRPIYKELYDQEEKLVFWNKITWLKNNAASFDESDTKRIYRIICISSDDI